MQVSVIIPTYNSEKYLSTAIKSVLAQTYKDFEIIIIDDGSTDKTREIVSSFNDKRIKYVYQDNSGVAIARNRGIGYSEGEYIAFLDSDDIWEPEKLEIQLDEIMREDGICMVYSAFEMLYEGIDFSKIFRYRELDSHDFIKHLIIDPFKTIPYPSTTLIKKSYLNKAGVFNPDFHTGEDWDLWLRLAVYGKCDYINQILVKKLSHRESITNSLDLEKTGEIHFRLLDKFFTENPDYSFLRPKSYSMIYYDIACRYLGRNKHRPNKGTYLNLFKSFITYPFLYLSKPKIQFAYNVLIKSKFKNLSG